MLIKLSHSLLENLTTSKHSFADLGPSYIHNIDAFLPIPLSDLKRIEMEHRAGVFVHQLKIWHPYLIKSTELGNFYQTEAEFEKNVSECEFAEYQQNKELKQSPMRKYMSHTYQGERHIYTETHVTVEDIFVIGNSDLVKQLLSLNEDKPLEPYLNPNHTHFSTKLAAAIKGWLALFEEGGYKEGRGVIDQCKNILSKLAPKLRSTPLNRIATIINPDWNNKEKESEK